MSLDSTRRRDLPASAVAALIAGEIVRAIDAVRQSEGVGFQEAKRRVERHIQCDPSLLSTWRKRQAAARRRLAHWARLLALAAVLGAGLVVVLHLSG